MLLSNAIRQRIINLSQSKHLSIKKLSRKSSVSYSNLLNFINGQSKTMNLSTLYNICIGLEINLFNFFDSPLFIDVLDEHEKSKN